MMKPILRFGSTGPVVKQLQNVLNLAPSVFPNLVADGIFGPKTDSRVREFQGQKKLAKDGVVGPLTWAMLKPLLDEYEKFVKQLVPPQVEAAARKAIVGNALAQYNAFKWAGQVSPLNHRIAGKICCNPQTRARQGGLHITTIFTIAGVNAQKCLTISEAAEAMYQRKYSAKERNDTDIVSWCGIFAVYVYKISGLKISSWPLKYNVPWGEQIPDYEFEIVKEPKPGDIGVVDPRGGNNHHFIVLNFDGTTITSIDGNAGTYMEIVKTNYTTYTVKQREGYFLSPVWNRLGVTA